MPRGVPAERRDPVARPVPSSAKALDSFIARVRIAAELVRVIAGDAVRIFLAPSQRADALLELTLEGSDQDAAIVCAALDPALAALGLRAWHRARSPGSATGAMAAANVKPVSENHDVMQFMSYSRVPSLP